MATIEADVAAHAEAVLHGRLHSELTQDKMELEVQQQRSASTDNIIGNKHDLKIGPVHTHFFLVWKSNLV